MTRFGWRVRRWLLDRHVPVDATLIGAHRHGIRPWHAHVREWVVVSSKPRITKGPWEPMCPDDTDEPQPGGGSKTRPLASPAGAPSAQERASESGGGK